MIRKNIAAGIALAALALGSTGARAEAITGDCTAARISYATPDNNPIASTNSTAWSNIPDAAVTFTQHGTKPGCIIVRFSASMAASAGAGAIVRAILDGSLQIPAIVGVPFTVQYASNDGYRAQSFDFVFPSVEPGPHTIRIQWKRSGAVGPVDVSDRSTVVHHR
jgi:hypothetical protein